MPVPFPPLTPRPANPGYGRKKEKHHMLDASGKLFQSIRESGPRVTRTGRGMPTGCRVCHWEDRAPGASWVRRVLSTLGEAAVTGISTGVQAHTAVSR